MNTLQIMVFATSLGAGIGMASGMFTLIIVWFTR